MAKERKVGNLLALAVLSYLSRRPMHPYELSRMLRDNNDVRSIKFNHGIPVHGGRSQLARAGFIAEQETSRDGPAPGTHRVRGHRRRPGRVPRLAARAGRAAAARVPAFRGRAVADRGAATGRGPHAAGQPAGRLGRAAHRDPRRDRPRTQPAGCIRCSWSRRTTGSPCWTPSRRSSSGSSARSPIPRPAGARCGPSSTASLQHRQHGERQES